MRVSTFERFFVLPLAFAIVFILIGIHCSHAGQWPRYKTWIWYQEVSPILGGNYTPRTAVNTTEMWQKDTFDPKTIDEELGWAKQGGYNSLRVNLQYLVWKDDPAGLKARMNTFLAIAQKHGIRTMFVPFDDCAWSGKEPYLGKQDDPVPGVHNSGWVPSPGLKLVTDKSAWPDLERYVKDIIGHFGKDKRVLIWDLYNEPGNMGLEEKSLPLVEAAFAWARETNPSQPLTVPAWEEFAGCTVVKGLDWVPFQSPMSKRVMELSDVVSFHSYDHPGAVRAKLEVCKQYGRPILCTEWLLRRSGNTVAAILPIFAENRVGAYHWGLVAGRTQTYMPGWTNSVLLGGDAKPGDPMTKVWHMDVFHPDGRPYDPKEYKALRRFAQDRLK